MSVIGKIRAATWAVWFSSTALFIYLGRTLPKDANAVSDLLLVVLPFQVGCIAVLVLMWIGPFPESWPLIGRRRRFDKVVFWIAAAILGAFWSFFYATFVFQII